MPPCVVGGRKQTHRCTIIVSYVSNKQGPAELQQTWSVQRWVLKSQAWGLASELSPGQWGVQGSRWIVAVCCLPVPPVWNELLELQATESGSQDRAWLGVSLFSMWVWPHIRELMGRSSHDTGGAHGMGEKRPTEHRNPHDLRTERPLGGKDRGLVMRRACCSQCWPWWKLVCCLGTPRNERGLHRHTHHSPVISLLKLVNCCWCHSSRSPASLCLALCAACKASLPLQDLLQDQLP